MSRNSNDSVFRKDKKAILINFIRHVPRMNAQTAFLGIAECEFEDNGVVKSWDSPKPIKNFTAAWNIGELTFNRHSVLFAHRKSFPLPLAGMG